MVRKTYDISTEALDGLLFDGMTIMSGGFGLCGVPENLIAAIRAAGTKDLTVISNNCGINDFGAKNLAGSSVTDDLAKMPVSKIQAFEAISPEILMHQGLGHVSPSDVGQEQGVFCAKVGQTQRFRPHDEEVVKV